MWYRIGDLIWKDICLTFVNFEARITKIIPCIDGRHNPTWLEKGNLNPHPHEISVKKNVGGDPGKPLPIFS